MLWALRWRRNIIGGAWCSRHGEWCPGYAGAYCGDVVAPVFGDKTYPMIWPEVAAIDLDEPAALAS